MPGALDVSPPPSAVGGAPEEENKTRLTLISNRLAVTVKKVEDQDGEYTYKESSGGLVTGISGIKKETDFTWYGWPGFAIPEAHRKEMDATLRETYSAVPVFLGKEDAERHYNGFSNSILWPLLHYHPGDVTFDEAAWAAYQKVNREFSAAVVADAKDGEIIWVHDYHHFILPQYLREDLAKKGVKDVRIGFFLHTPFASSEMFRILPVPVREGILTSLLQCDLVGFHTYDYARHFLSSCQRILSNVNTQPNGAEYNGRFVSVGAFPIGIDPYKFDNAFAQEKVMERVAEMKEKFKGKKVIVGVDRLDYIKGMPQKLHSFELFLKENEEFRGKVVLVQVAVPSREDVDEYRALWHETNQLVGRINGKYGNVDYTPIQWLYHSIEFEEMAALYAISDVCLVTSTRDGMNLVSYEYIAAQQIKGDGVLILSEFAGAAQSLNGAVLINPWNTEEVAKAILTAVTMPEEQRRTNITKLKEYVYNYTSQWWGRSFVGELKKAHMRTVDPVLEAVSSYDDELDDEQAIYGAGNGEHVFQE